MTPVKNVTVTANYSFAQHEYTAMNRSANYPYSRVPGEVLWKQMVMALILFMNVLIMIGFIHTIFMEIIQIHLPMCTM